MASQLTMLVSMYSASMELKTTKDCFLLNQEITHEPKLNQKPKVLFLPPTSPTESKSTYHLPHISNQKVSCPLDIRPHVL
jgi:hypothetical protein